MALQVGSSCYATPADASAAACASVGVQSAVLGSGSVVSTSCSGVNSAGGYFLQVRTTDTAGAVVSTVQHPVAPVWQPCQHPDYVAGAELIVASLLALWAGVWGYRRLIALLDSWRGE